MAFKASPQSQVEGHSASMETRPGRAVHHVKPGESLADIARLHGTTTSALMQLNNHQLGSNGLGLSPGMRLEI